MLDPREPLDKYQKPPGRVGQIITDIIIMFETLVVLGGGGYLLCKAAIFALVP